jgi:hypothetical protein
MIYNPNKWYWSVAGSAVQVWSSATMSYVAVTDTDYVAWLAAGYQTGRVASIGEMWQVMVQTLPSLLSVVEITSTATPALDGVYDIDPTSLAQITALSTGLAAGKPIPGGGSTFNYPDASGTMHAFTSADFVNFAAAVEDMIYTAEQAISTMVNGTPASMPSPALTIA